MYPELPDELSRLKEADSAEPYDPPYESEQGQLQPRPNEVPASGIEVDMRVSQEARNPNIPPIEDDESPAGGVDRRGEAGEQGDDEMHDFRGE